MDVNIDWTNLPGDTDVVIKTAMTRPELSTLTGGLFALPFISPEGGYNVNHNEKAESSTGDVNGVRNVGLKKNKGSTTRVSPVVKDKSRVHEPNHESMQQAAARAAYSESLQQLQLVGESTNRGNNTVPPGFGPDPGPRLGPGVGIEGLSLREYHYNGKWGKMHFVWHWRGWKADRDDDRDADGDGIVRIEKPLLIKSRTEGPLGSIGMGDGGLQIQRKISLSAQRKSFVGGKEVIKRVHYQNWNRKIQELQALASRIWLSTSQAVVIANSFPHTKKSPQSDLMLTFRQEVIIILFSRLVDLDRFPLLIHTLPIEDQLFVCRRIGWLNVLNVFRMDSYHHYELDFSVQEECTVAYIIVQLVYRGGGLRLVEVKFKRDAHQLFIPGWEVPNSWLGK